MGDEALAVGGRAGERGEGPAAVAGSDGRAGRATCGHGAAKSAGHGAAAALGSGAEGCGVLRGPRPAIGAGTRRAGKVRSLAEQIRAIGAEQWFYDEEETEARMAMPRREALLRKLWDLACAGSLKAADMILAYSEGKPVQRVEADVAATQMRVSDERLGKLWEQVQAFERRLEGAKPDAAQVSNAARVAGAAQATPGESEVAGG